MKYWVEIAWFYLMMPSMISRYKKSISIVFGIVLISVNRALDLVWDFFKFNGNESKVWRTQNPQWPDKSCRTRAVETIKSNLNLSSSIKINWWWISHYCISVKIFLIPVYVWKLAETLLEAMNSKLMLKTQPIRREFWIYHLQLSWIDLLDQLHSHFWPIAKSKLL